ncbi:uncharacterized protein LOC126325548 [Schistocerca gregaria]|uniref:uncharacterized protein LOC126325548 n=1 Tax=Schistocerca gregaria TaxID=7010 RepID=UPI00211DCEB9|nr:uncharacterized protein LOC126325548 [Schistocerca gregaria]XP_049851216.1 uncharacterized protein LOC126325548 [Schistocerca gregaria]
MLKEKSHPVYRAEDFEDEKSYEEWKAARMSELGKRMEKMKSRRPFEGMIKVSMSRAREVALGKGAVKVYYVVKVGGEKRDSKRVSYKGEGELEFEKDEFSFSVNERDSRIKIDVWYRRYLSSVLVGSVKTNVNELMWEDQPVERWWELESSTGGKEVAKVYGVIETSYKIGSVLGGRKEEVNGPKWYVCLMYIVLKYECREGELERGNSENVISSFGGTGTSTSGSSFEGPGEGPSQLGEWGKWVLDEFADRYFVDPTYKKLVYIELLVEWFNPRSVRYLETLHDSLVDLVAWREAEAATWGPAGELYERVVGESLEGKLRETLCRYFEWFPRNEPEGALSLIVVLYSVVMRLDVGEMMRRLSEGIKEEMEMKYKRVVEERLVEESVIEACQFVSYAIEQDERYFEGVFPMELGLLQLSVETYYELLCRDVRSLLKNSLATVEDMMTLYESLDALNKKLSRLGGVQVEVMQLNRVFQPGVERWVRRIDRQLPEWFKSTYMKEETWVAVSANDPKCALLHARSAHVLFEVFGQIYKRYRMFDTRLARDMQKLESVFTNAVETYMVAIVEGACETFEVMCVGEWGINRFCSGGEVLPLIAEEKHNGEAGTNDPRILTKSCVWISTLEMMTKRLYEFQRWMKADEGKDDETRQYFESTFTELVGIEQQICELVVRRINSNPRLESIIEGLIGTPD